ncbi:MAG: helix-turn-helix transcriptional regulator [Erysipelotrichales bacterium]|nr:helix-turn-helix transcriptional regulator [Erysipelotrichales bacterium]MBQ1386101.1 helix-turn-helix transcriptional regulator [Erysipelotrichales bacterium]MBQ4010928.1 helix-turn-helix transcriptional regulator [Erysipelotrichales bacterium]MBQ4374693.1 helix-turn-helix transcriptional regulator [Erysipelotrichales bacterium]
MDNIVLTEATYYILLALVNPQHGYGIMQETEAMSNGRVHLAAGTLYGALNAMTEKGWIEQLPTEDGSRKKNYQLTASGLEVLTRELKRLKELVRNGEEMLGGIDND